MDQPLLTIIAYSAGGTGIVRMYVRPIDDVHLIECRDRMALVPVCAHREF
ncbi:MAG TPA: hypothetical protein VLW52_14665 [Opitutaceae bacterium]|nr:hypothetical protein [Opitutaceae bacterium]